MLKKICFFILLLGLIGCREKGQNVPATAEVVVLQQPTKVSVTVEKEVVTEVAPVQATAKVTAVMQPTVTPQPTEEPLVLPEYVERVAQFLHAVQDGLDGSGSDAYLSRSLQAAVISGRPLPNLIGVQDYFQTFTLTDLGVGGVPGQMRVRVRFEFDSPTYAIFTLIEQEGNWRIHTIAQHNLVRSLDSETLIGAEDQIVAYYAALSTHDPARAFQILSASAQAKSSVEALRPVSQGMVRASVTTMQPTRYTVATGELAVYVRLFVNPDLTVQSSWVPGDNTRWVILTQDETGWRISRIINSPRLADVESWQRVYVTPIQMQIDIPNDWVRSSLLWSWSPDSLGIPALSVNWMELHDNWSDDHILPSRIRMLASNPVDLGWAQGMQYSYEVMGNLGEAPMMVKSSIIVRSSRYAYNFSANALTLDDLENMRPLLQRMVAGVVIADDQASSFSAVETGINFLASLIRDETAVSANLYLTASLQEKGFDRNDIYEQLGVKKLNAFNVTWLESNSDGQVKLGLFLMANGESSVEKIMWVAQNSAGDWVIEKIE